MTEEKRDLSGERLAPGFEWTTENSEISWINTDGEREYCTVTFLHRNALFFKTYAPNIHGKISTCIEFYGKYYLLSQTPGGLERIFASFDYDKRCPKWSIRVLSEGETLEDWIKPGSPPMYDQHDLSYMVNWYFNHIWLMHPTDGMIPKNADLYDDYTFLKTLPLLEWKANIKRVNNEYKKRCKKILVDKKLVGIHIFHTSNPESDILYNWRIWDTCNKGHINGSIRLRWFNAKKGEYEMAKWSVKRSIWGPKNNPNYMVPGAHLNLLPKRYFFSSTPLELKLGYEIETCLNNMFLDSWLTNIRKVNSEYKSRKHYYHDDQGLGFQGPGSLSCLIYWYNWRDLNKIELNDMNRAIQNSKICNKNVKIPKNYKYTGFNLYRDLTLSIIKKFPSITLRKVSNPNLIYTNPTNANAIREVEDTRQEVRKQIHF